MKTRSVFALGLGLGIGLGAMITGLITGPRAVAQIAPLTPPRQQGTQIMLDERRLESVYANGFRLHTSAEEVVADLGFNMPNPSPTGAQSADLLFDVRMRLIMSFATAKRFQESLGTLITRYEDMYGPIRTDPPQPRAGAGTGTGTGSGTTGIGSGTR